MTPAIDARSFSLATARAAIRQGVRRALLAAAAPRARWLLLIAFLFVLGWLMYTSLWRQLAAPAPLPAGVNAEDPQLNTDHLRAITSQRAERMSRPVLPRELTAPAFRVPTPSPAER